MQDLKRVIQADPFQEQLLIGMLSLKATRTVGRTVFYKERLRVVRKTNVPTPNQLPTVLERIVG
jgi:hypothetical protein